MHLKGFLWRLSLWSAETAVETIQAGAGLRNDIGLRISCWIGAMHGTGGELVASCGDHQGAHQNVQRGVWRGRCKVWLYDNPYIPKVRPSLVSFEDTNFHVIRIYIKPAVAKLQQVETSALCRHLCCNNVVMCNAILRVGKLYRPHCTYKHQDGF